MAWVSANPQIATALIAALSAIAGAIIAAGVKFLLDFYMSERLKRRWQTVETKRKYSAPIVRAVDDFAGRIDNLNRYLGAMALRLSGFGNSKRRSGSRSPSRDTIL